MATVLFSSIADGSTISFDPASDLLSIDDSGLSAASLILEYDDDLTHIGMTLDGKSFFLPTSVTLTDLTTDNVVFDDGSLLMVGTNVAEFVTGYSGNDYLLGLAGADQLSGGAGADWLDGGTGADRMFGGLGDDTYIVDNVNDVAIDTPAITRRVSLTGADAESNGSSFMPGVSGNGRYVVFDSEASNLVAGDSNSDEDVFVKDLQTGEILRLSETAVGTQGNGDSFNAQIAADGRYIVFESNSTNLAVGGDTNGVTDIFVKDMQNGTIGRVSTSTAGVQANAECTISDISADGHYVVFESTASNLVSGDTNGKSDIFVKNLLTGETVRVSTNDSDNQIGARSSDAKISGDGSAIVFTSPALSLVAVDTNGQADIFVKNWQTGDVELASTSSAGVQANGLSSNADLSEDGRYVVFESDATNLVNGDTNATTDIFVKDMQTGITQRVTTSVTGTQANALSQNADISADGRYVVFQSQATNLVSGLSAGNTRIFVKDLETGKVALVSVSSSGEDGRLSSFNPQISADGRFIVFKSGSNNLVDGDGNGSADIFSVENPFMRDGTDTVRASVSFTLHSSIENLVLRGSTNIDGTGNDLDNVITGNSGDNTLAGGDGDDTLNGGDGDDTYVLSDPDTVTEASNKGTDIIRADFSYTLTANCENLTLTGSGNINGTGNSANNVITGNGGNNTISGGGGDDTLNGGGGADTMRGGDGDDTYIMSSNTGDVLTEDADEGTDTVKASINYALAGNFENLVLTGSGDIDATGNSKNNVLTGNDGDNTLSGGGGNDTLIGGKGNDVYVLGSGDTVTENDNEGKDTIMTAATFALGGASIENLTLTGSGDIDGTGNSLDNEITGNSGDNNLSGGAGNDTLTGGGGRDTLRGGSGNDIYMLTSGVNIVENADQGTDTVMTSASFTLSSGSIENLTLIGSGNINGTGNSISNEITGNSGNNTLLGGAGNDTLAGGGGQDKLNGGSGNDIYILSNADTISESSGNGTDTVKTSISYTLASNLENLTLTGSGDINGTGNSQNNVINGNSGDNILNGGGGNDTLHGAGGDDTYILSSPDTVIEASGGGTDTVRASFSYTLGSNIENLILTGGSTAKGNSLGNSITGNSGDNTINGSTGNDILSGGNGEDTFVFNTALSNTTNVDVLKDFFSDDDTVNLDHTIFKKLQAGTILSPSFFAFNPKGVAQDSNDYIAVSTTTGALYYDADGSGSGARVQFGVVLTDISPFDFFIV